ncbi:lipoprotein-releasing ABC transporter permease subunit [bacterium]|nr:MAG: lipoprotein-releasing ABC transporter permease subunit [bacterium]
MSRLMGFELWIAYRYMRVRAREIFIKLITWLSVGGVAIGVMALVVVLAVMTGFEKDLREKIIGANPHVKITAKGKELKNYEELAKAALEVKGVKSARPYVERKMMISTKKSARGVLLRGVKAGAASGLPDLDRVVNSTDLSVTAGREMGPGILLGAELAKNLGVMQGDKVRVFSPGGAETPAGFLPRFRVFTVVETFVTGMYEYDSAWVLIDLDEARDFLRMEEGVTGIDIRVEEPANAASLARAIEGKAGGDYLVRDWMEMNRSLFGAMKLEKLTMFLVLGLIIVVAAFNIASTLIMVVMDKTRDIGILKSMGASKKAIMQIFMLKGALIGVTGTVLGVFLGVSLGLLLKSTNILGLPPDVFYMSAVPVEMQAGTIAVIALSSVFVCLAATVYPAWQAARLDPVETIRYE